jgi:hypothetical protein
VTETSFFNIQTLKAMLTVKAKTRNAGRLVNTGHVDTIIRNYKQERWVNNSKHIGKEDSLSVWFTIEELEAFMAKAKSHGADGMRFYFGAYSDDYAETPLYAGRQTVVMVATQAKETPNGVTDKDLYVSSGNEANILAYNSGKLCPPFCRPITDDDDFGGVGITIVDKGDDGISIV